MKYNRAQPRNISPAGLIVLVFFLFFSFAAVSRGEQPSASFGAPRWGTSVRLPSQTMTSLPTTLRNPSESAISLLISVTPDRAGEGTLVNQRLIRIGPRAVLRDRLRFLSHATESYTSDLIDPASGALLAREQIASSYETQAVRKRLFVIDDGEDFPVATEMSRLNLMNERVQVTRATAAEAPFYWIDYGASSIILLVQPDFSAMHDGQFQAIIDFVIGGGTLFIVHPETLLAAAETPLADLLPVDPMAPRRVEELPELSAWFAPYRKAGLTDAPDSLKWPAGLMLLESVARSEAHTVLAHGPYPLVAWSKAGGGVVGVCTFDAGDPLFRLSQAGLPLWNHLLSWSHAHPLTMNAVFSPPLQEAAERLTGFQAADAGSIQLILAANLIFVGLIFILARLARRQPIGWIFLGCYGLAITGAIFYVAFQQMREQPRRSMITIEITSHLADRQVGLQSVSLFAQHDASPVPGTDSMAAAFLPATTPNIDLNPLAMFQERLRESLQIRRQDGQEHLRNFALSALRRRTVGCAFTSRNQLSPTPADALSGGVLIYGADGPRLDQFTLPPELPAETALYLTGGGGARRLQPQNGGRWVMEPEGARLLQLNPVETRFRQHIVGDWLPPQRLILLYPNPQPRFEPPVGFENREEEYAQIRYTMEMLPVQEKSESGPIAIPAAMIDIKPADRAAQTLLWQDEHSYMQSGGAYLFAAHLPAFLGTMQVEQVEVSVRLLNPEGDAAARIELVPFADPDHQAHPDGQIPAGLAGIETRAGSFVFDTADIKGLTDPLTGRLLLRLHIEPTRETAAATMVDRAIRWRLLEIRATAQGHHADSALERQNDDGV